MSDKPKLEVKDGKVYATTLDIADYFNREHHKVLRAISNLLPHLSEQFIHANIVGYKGKSKQGKEIDAYVLTRSGFAMIALGFTGDKAIKFREAYINRFDEMEDQLRRKQFHIAKDSQLELFPDFKEAVERDRPAMPIKFAYEQMLRKGLQPPSVETFRKMLHTGELEGYKTHIWFIYEDSFVKFLNKRK